MRGWLHQVVRCALENAASVARTFLMSDVVVCLPAHVILHPHLPSRQALICWVGVVAHLSNASPLR